MDNKFVRVKFRGSDGEEHEEINILLGDGSLEIVDMLHQPGTILLEDDQGLWYLDESDLISMNPATEDEYEAHWSDVRKRDSHLWN